MSKEKELDDLSVDYTPEELDKLINGEFEGDTGSELPEEGSKPEATSGEGDGDKAGDDIDFDKLNAENAEILAKDGKHTISFDKLVEARQQAQEAKQQAEEARAELERLKAEAQERADSGEQQTENDKNVEFAQKAIDSGVDPAVFGDFSEEAMAQGVLAIVRQELGQALAPMRQREQQSETEAHYQAIYAAHPDADSLVESQELAAWLQAQPTFAQAAYQQVLNNGSAEQIVELFDTFKQSSGLTQAAPASDKKDVRAAAQKAIENAQEQVPASLSDFAGGRAGSNKADAMADMDGVELLDEMAGMTPEQIDQYLNRL